MTVYLCEFLSVFIFAYCFDKERNPRAKRTFLILMGVILAGFMGLRYGVGMDYFYTYVPVYEKIYDHQDAGVEIGYVILNKICIFLCGSNSQSIFILCAAIMIPFLLISCKKVDAPMYLMMYIFLCGGYYFYSFNVMRQCMATFIFYYSLGYVQEDAKRGNRNHMMKYMVLNLLGASIHTSALIYLPVYFFLKRDFKKKTYITMLILFVVFTGTLMKVLEFMLEDTKYYNYLNGMYADTTKLVNVSQIINVLMFLVYMFTKPRKDDHTFIILRNIQFIGVLIMFLMGTLPLVYRLSTLFHLVSFLSIPYYYKHYVKGKHMQKLVILGIHGVYAGLLANALMQNANTVLPYRSVIFK